MSQTTKFKQIYTNKKSEAKGRNKRERNISILFLHY